MKRILCVALSLFTDDFRVQSWDNHARKYHPFTFEIRLAILTLESKSLIKELQLLTEIAMF